MTDDPEMEVLQPVTPAPSSVEGEERATPEERLAETQPDDPEVGVDGTGMGELP